jgi:hypothetical protein
METPVATPWDHGAQTNDLASADLTNDVSVYQITPMYDYFRITL